MMIAAACFVIQLQASKAMAHHADDIEDDSCGTSEIWWYY
jgi:hypothetical protein